MSWHRDRLLLALSLVVVIGLMASLYGYNDYASGGQLCDVVFGDGIVDCESVYVYGYIDILGLKLHFSELAPVYFILVTLALSLHILLGLNSLIYLVKALLYVGLLAIPYLVYLEIFKANAICIFCTVMHASIIAGSFISHKLS